MDYTVLIKLMYSLPELPFSEEKFDLSSLTSIAGEEHDVAEMAALVEKINEFSSQSNFEKVWDVLAVYRDETLEVLETRKPSPTFMQQIEAFYGDSFEHYELVPSLTIWSGPGWGITTPERDKASFILGPLAENYDFTADRFTSLAIHEFGHPFVNHIVMENMDPINQTEDLFSEIKSSMELQGYGNWLTCIIEHFVRAGEVLISEQMGELPLSNSLKEDYAGNRNFIYLSYIVEKLREYRIEKKFTYPQSVRKTLIDFQKTFSKRGTQVSTVEGVLTASQSGKPIPFAHIGVKGKNLGTISRPDGTFSVDVSQASISDSLTFSSVGYKTITYPISSLDERLNVSMEEEAILLNEVIVTTKKKKVKYEKFGRYKPTKVTRGQNGFRTFGFGGEQGIRINNTKTYQLDEISFHMRFNSVDSILFRINIYEVKDGLPGKSLLSKNLFVTSKKGQKWIRKKVKDQVLVIDQDIIVSYEVVQIWYNEKNQNNIYFTFGEAYPEGGVFLRRSSLDKWITQEPEAFPITLYVSGIPYE